MLRGRWAYLHLHTVLSACAEVEMIPPLIVRRALALGLDWIAVTDHNAAANVRAVMQAAEGSGLAVSPGMEVEIYIRAKGISYRDWRDMKQAVSEREFYRTVYAGKRPFQLEGEED